MARIIMLIPIAPGVGLTSVSLGTFHAMERRGVKVSFFKPIAQPRMNDEDFDLTTTLIKANSTLPVAEPMSIKTASSMISANQIDELLEDIVARFKNGAKDCEVVLIEGLLPTRQHSFASKINYEIAKTLNAEIVLVSTPGNLTAEEVADRVEVAAMNYGGIHHQRIKGAIVNKLNSPIDDSGLTRPDFMEGFVLDGAQHGSERITHAELDATFRQHKIELLGCIPWNINLIATRAIDIAESLGAKIINEGEIKTRRVKSITFCARSLQNMVAHFKPNSLLVTSADRPAVIVAACLAAMNGVELGAILLTGGYELDDTISELCHQACKTGLPIFTTNGNTWQTAQQLQSLNLEVPAEDKERVEFCSNWGATHIKSEFIDALLENTTRDNRLSPPAFRYQLTELARLAKKRIVLPEGDEPRTIKAAVICAERGIAECILLGDPEEIQRVAAQQGVLLTSGISIVNPKDVAENYVPRLVELRKGKGITEVVAREQLEDTVVLGTMMLEAGEVDGLVSGAVHTTANTIRPPLQIIKTAPNSSIVSSVFFMLLPDQVLVYGDCAINPDPNAEQLAEIAIQSADSAMAFGIEPRVAMISYSTGTSGAGADVEKVREATQIAKAKRPDLVIDGPLQYDAAIMENVAKSKAPESPVAGRATVFIFPDLNTGNTTYKAVQRSADLVSIGPMLQGMRKPVNDLSRGALVDDIIYTIALTAIQAKQAEEQ